MLSIGIEEVEVEFVIERWSFKGYVSIWLGVKFGESLKGGIRLVHIVIV